MLKKRQSNSWRYDATAHNCCRVVYLAKRARSKWTLRLRKEVDRAQTADSAQTNSTSVMVGAHSLASRPFFVSQAALANEERPLPLSCQVMDYDKCYLNKDYLRKRAPAMRLDQQQLLATVQTDFLVEHSQRQRQQHQQQQQLLLSVELFLQTLRRGICPIQFGTGFAH